MTRSAVRCAVEAVEARTLFAAPAIDNIANYAVPVGDPIQIPVTSTSTGGAVTFSAKSTSKNIKAGFRTSPTYIEMKVAGYSQPMVFQLFGDTTPDTVRRITGLINAKYYDGLTFHRILNNFVIQGGDPNGDGTGGPDSQFDDEFSDSTVFSGTGQLAMANSGKDTNGSQFFITEGSQRALDFNHTIFGQLVRGESTRAAISDVATNSSGKPNTDVVISSVRVINDNTDGVLLVKGLAAGVYTVKVTGTNADGSDSDSFTLTVTNTDDSTSATPNVNDPPILNVGSIQPVYYGQVGVPITFNLSSYDPDGNANNFFVAQYVQQNGANGSFGGTNQNLITITPTTTGLIELKVGVIESSTATARGSTSISNNDPLTIADSQTIRIAVGDAQIAAKAYDSAVTAGATTKSLAVGYFTSASSASVVGNYTAQIDWGDGTVTNGTIAKNSKGRFVVYADKAYASKVAGYEPVTLTVTGKNGAFARADSTISVTQPTNLQDGVLTINGTVGNDTVGVDRKKGNFLVTVNGVTSVFATGTVTKINAYGGAGNDLIRFTPRVYAPTYLEGGDGDDTIEGGSGVDVINAGAGNDSVSTGLGFKNRVAGGEGNDTLYGGDDRDILYGGAGDDYIIGGAGRDLIVGDEGNDTLLGGGSNDTIYGGLGNDVINGNGGADLIDGSAGRDTVKQDVLDTITNCEIFV